MESKWERETWTFTVQTTSQIMRLPSICTRLYGTCVKLIDNNVMGLWLVVCSLAYRPRLAYRPPVSPQWMPFNHVIKYRLAIVKCVDPICGHRLLIVTELVLGGLLSTTPQHSAALSIATHCAVGISGATVLQRRP